MISRGKEIMWFSGKAAERTQSSYKAMKRERDKGIEIPRSKKGMSKAEKWLVIGTLGICSGVWTTLGYLIHLNSF